MSDHLPVGLIGLGKMGLPMAQRLLNAGYPVIGFDTSEAACDRFVAIGGARATSAADVSARTATVILMLPNSDIVESVLDGGVVAAATPGTLIIDMSSSEPLRTRQAADRLTAAGLRFIDAPVSGGVAGAVAGTLTIMAGGPEADVVGVTPMLSSMGKVTRVGAAGSGHALKALNNLMSATHLWISCEALAVAEAFGIDPHTMVAVVNTSTGKSASTERKLPQFIIPETFNSGFALNLMVKDVSIATKLAADLGVAHPLADTALAFWSDAASRLPVDADHTEVAKVAMGQTNLG